MLRKILKMFKESNILKVHIGIILVGLAMHIFWDKDIAYTVIAPVSLLICTIVARILIEKKYRNKNEEWVEDNIDEHARYAKLEASAEKMCPHYVHLHKMMREKMSEMGVSHEKHLHPTWLVTFSFWLYALAKQYETFEMTDIQVAAAIMNSLTSPADSDEHIMIIFNCVKDMIKAPKKYEVKYEEGTVILQESTTIMPISDPDEYIALKGEKKFVADLRTAISNRENANDETTVCGVFYDMYYLTKSM